MKKSIILLFSICLLFLLTICLFANEEESSCVNKTTYIYYCNGIMNSPTEADKGTIAIRGAYKNDLKIKYPEEKFKFNGSYNFSKSLLADLYEVIDQKIDEPGGLSAVQLLKIARKPADQALRLLQDLVSTTNEGKIIVDEAKLEDIWGHTY